MEGRTDRRHAMAIPYFAHKVHRAVNIAWNAWERRSHWEIADCAKIAKRHHNRSRQWHISTTTSSQHSPKPLAGFNERNEGRLLNFLRHDIAATCVLKMPLNPNHPFEGRLRERKGEMERGGSEGWVGRKGGKEGRKGRRMERKGREILPHGHFKKSAPMIVVNRWKKDDNDMFKMNTNKVPSVTYSGRRQSRSKSSNRLKSTAEKLKEFW